jgi:hypothetical protein
MREMDDYINRLAGAKERYPFRKWAEWGIEQHTERALSLFAAVLNRLIERLSALGEQAPERDKIAAIRQAVEELNALNVTNEILIETGEREDLCKLFDIIATEAGLDPSRYADGEGPADEWRAW